MPSFTSRVTALQSFTVYVSFGKKQKNKENSRTFVSFLTQTPVCNLGQYDSCARRYVDIARQQNWLEPIPKDILGYDELQRCRE